MGRSRCGGITYEWVNATEKLRNAADGFWANHFVIAQFPSKGKTLQSKELDVFVAGVITLRAEQR